MVPVRLVQKIVIALILSGNIFLWSLSSDIVAYIAGDQTLVFGRYSLGRFNALIICLVVSGIAVYLLWGPRSTIKDRILRTITVIASGCVALTIVDSAARWIMPPTHYSPQQSGLRTSDNTYTVTIKDVPGAVRRIPRPMPGFAPLKCTVSMDTRGFRNTTSLDSYDIVALGDSFTEGFYVSDDHPWPVVFSRRSGLSVCNLGMSGTDPLMYLLALKKFGLARTPRAVICMLTEISDFKTALDDAGMKRFEAAMADDRIVRNRKDFRTPKPSMASRMKAYYHRSPLKVAFNNLCQHDLARLHLHGEIEGMDILSWMPLRVPAGPNGKYYHFTPNRLLDLYQPADAFAASAGWKTAVYAIHGMQQLCRQSGIRLVLAYAPNKIHVILPLVKDRLPADKVKAFAALKSDRTFPDAEHFMTTLIRRIEVQETVLSDFCRINAITFVSTTKALREQAARGEQLYFTYDSHWTPPGHRVVADEIYRRAFARNAPGAASANPNGTSRIGDTEKLEKPQIGSRDIPGRAAAVCRTANHR